MDHKPWSRRCCRCLPAIERPSVLTLSRALFIALLISFLVLGVFFFEELRDYFLICLNWVDRLGIVYGALLLCGANIVGAILFLPCLPFTLASGLLYGSFWGTIIVSIASTIACTVSFLIARYLARKLVEQRLGSKGSRFRLIDNAINKDGFRIVFLIRSSPIHPYGVCNYLFGLTSITLRDYTLASFLAMLPTTICEVYFGTAMKTIADIITGNLEDSVASRIFFWGGLILTVVITVYVTMWLKQKLQSELDKYEYTDECTEPVLDKERREREIAEEEDKLTSMDALSPHAIALALTMGDPATLNPANLTQFTHESVHHSHHSHASTGNVEMQGLLPSKRY